MYKVKRSIEVGDLQHACNNVVALGGKIQQVLPYFDALSERRVTYIILYTI